MSKKIVILILSLYVINCSTKPTGPLYLSPEDERIRTVVFTVNSKIWGDYGKKNKSDFLYFNEASYTEYLEGLKSPRAQDMRDLMPLFTTKDFTYYTKTFVFCGFSPRMGIAFCDDASCQGTEYFQRTEDPDLIQKWKPLMTPGVCKKNSSR